MEKGKRRTVFLSAVVIAMALNPVTAAASEEELYNYVYDGEKQEVSVHLSNIEYEDGTKQAVTPNLFKLEDTSVSGGEDSGSEENGEPETVYRAAYCCDVKTTINTKQQYKCVNIEDAGYFDDETAARLRGIVTTGYWHDWDEESLSAAEKAANDWITSQGRSDAIAALTKDEAMTATQAAIWHTACNPETDAEISAIAPYGRTKSGEQAGVNTKNNIDLFYEYLLNLPARTSEDPVFTDEFFVTEKKADAQGVNVTLKFRLAGKIGGEDNLKLTAALGDYQSRDFALTGDNALVPDEKGYYSITFYDVAQEELQSMVKLSLSGKQSVDGVYFYEAKPAEGSDARSTSQNLIGKMMALVAVYAEDVFELSAVLEEEPPQDSTKVPEPEADEGIKKADAVMASAVKTGDDAALIPWIVTALCALACAAAVAWISRKKNRKSS